MRPGRQRDRFLADEMAHNLGLVRRESKFGRQCLADDELRRAGVAHFIEQAAEAAHKTSNAFKTANPRIPWERLQKFRTALAHTYDERGASATVDTIWEFARDEAPVILKNVRRAKFPRDE